MANKYTEGDITYTKNSDGSVFKFNNKTGAQTTVKSGDSNMKYIPSAVGGTRKSGSSSGSSSGDSPSVTYDNRDSGSSKAADTKKTTTRKTTRVKDEDDFDNEMSKERDSYSTPYEKALRDLLAQSPSYSTLSDDEIQKQAANLASLQIDPQLMAMKQSLEDAQLSARTQEGKVNSAYAGWENQMQRLLGEAGDQATESAISRGGGRSGAVEWLTDKLQTPVIEQGAIEQAERTSTLTAIADALAQTQSQYGDSVEALEASRGQLTAAQVASLSQSNQANALTNWQTKYNATADLDSRAQNAQQNDYNNAQENLPYVTTTKEQDITNDQTDAELYGQVLDKSTKTSANVTPLRTYIQSTGGTVGYDNKTKTVTINGKSYSSSQLKSLGGVLKNNNWYLPQSAIDDMR